MQNYMLNKPNISTSVSVESQILNLTSTPSASNKTNTPKAGKDFNEIFQSTTNKQNDLMKKVDSKKQQSQPQSQNATQVDSNDNRGNRAAKSAQGSNAQSTKGAGETSNKDQAQGSQSGQKASDTQSAPANSNSNSTTATAAQDGASSVARNIVQGIAQDNTPDSDPQTTEPVANESDAKNIKTETVVKEVGSTAQSTKDALPVNDLTVVAEAANTPEPVSEATHVDIAETVEHIDALNKQSDSNLSPEVETTLKEIKAALEKMNAEHVLPRMEDLKALNATLENISKAPQEVSVQELEALLEDFKATLDTQSTVVTTPKPLDEAVVAGAASNIQTQTTGDKMAKSAAKDTSANDTSVPVENAGKGQDKLLVDAKNVSGHRSDHTHIDKTAKTVNVQQQIAEQKILDELNLSIDKIAIGDNGTAKDTPPSKTTVSASEQLVKMSIEKTDVKTSFDAPQVGVHSQQDLKTTQNVSQTAQAPKELNKNDLLNQIGVKFDQIKNNGVNTKITMTLRPIELGRVSIELSQTSKGLVTTIIAQSQQVKEILEKNIEALRQQLSGSGVNVQNINVKVAAETSTNFSGSDFGQSDDDSDENLGRDTSDEGSKQGKNNPDSDDSETSQK